MTMYLEGKSGGLSHENHKWLSIKRKETLGVIEMCLQQPMTRELTLKSALKQVRVSAVDGDTVKASSTNRDCKFVDPVCIKTYILFVF